MLRIMLVDDEKLARDRLRRMLDDDTDYQVVGEAFSGEQAIKQAAQLAPDIVLIDIRMPGMDGLQAAQQLAQQESPPAIIFCTAYDEYAISAFAVQAVGYVLKPVRRAALLDALGRAQRVSRVQLGALSLAPNKRSATSERSHLTVTTTAGLELLSLDDISHFRAEQKYVMAFCAGRERVMDDSLKTLEQAFESRFLRIHRNCLVSVAHIEAIQRTKTGQSQLRLRGIEEPLTVSRRHLAQVKKMMKQI